MNNLTCSIIADGSLFIFSPPALKFLTLCSTSIPAFGLLVWTPIMSLFGFLQLNLALSFALPSDLSILFPSSPIPAPTLLS